MNEWLSEANRKGILDAAVKLHLAPAKLLNLIVAVALEELEGVDGEIIETLETVRTEEPH